MDLTAAESKATYEEIKKDVAEHNDGMKVYILYLIQHDSYMSYLLYLRKIFLYTIECTLRKHSIVMNKKPTNIRFYSQCPKAQ